MSKKAIKQSKRYVVLKKLQYDKAVRESQSELKRNIINNYAFDRISQSLANHIGKQNTIVEANFLDRILNASGEAARIRYKKTLKKGITTLVDLGIKHTVMDMLYEIPSVRKIYDNKDAKFSSLEGNLSQFIGNDLNIAEFSESNSFDNLSKKEQDAIRRADEELARISFSLDELEERGVISDIRGRSKRIARMSYEERYRYLYLIKQIDNFRQRAEASKYSFISDTYQQRRQQILTDDFGGKYDKQIKELLVQFLKEENRYITSITNKERSVQDLKNEIFIKLQELDRKNRQLTKKQANSVDNKVIYSQRADRIIATEVSTAYNFGKLIGFSSLEDLDKQFIWNADWELEIANSLGDYEVCEACARMDGRSFTIRDLLLIGTELDVGAGGFIGANRTDFKNPSLPMIPFHPNCNCFDANAIVTCEYGNISIDSIKVGDKVKVPTSSEYETVTKIHKNWYTGNAKKITVDYGSERRETITCTENHPFWTSEGWKDANDLRVDEHVFIETKKLGQTSSGTSTELSRAEICDVVRRESKDYTPSNKGASESIKYSVSQRLRSTKTGFKKCLLARTTGKGGEVSRAFNDKTLNNIRTKLAQTWRVCKNSVFKGHIFKCIESGIEDKQQSGSSYVERYESTSSVCQSIRQNLSNLWSRGEMRLSRGLKTVFQKWVGSGYCKNIQYIKDYLEVRARSLSIIRQYEICTGFLPSRLQSLCGSEREMEAILPREGTDISGDGEFFIDNSGRRVQGFEENFQNLSKVRVVSIESVFFNDYVYNLTVSNTPVYFVNDVLVHNCYWTLISDDRRFDSEDLYEDIPIESVRQLDPDGKFLPKTKASLVMQLAGAGLIVGGAFLLSRSNIWNIFAKNVIYASYNIEKKQATEIFIETIDFIEDVIEDKDIQEAFIDTIIDASDSAVKANTKIS